MPMEKNVKVALVSLGCAKNRVDAESMLGILAERGYEIEMEPSRADAIIVNTCGFIQSAKEESISTVLEMAQYKEEGRCKALLMTGCLSQRYAKDMQGDLPEVDAFLGIGHIDEIDQAIQNALKGQRTIANERPYSFVEGERLLSTSPFAYLKVADGCDNRCTYCAIPLIRGGYVSRPLETVIEEAKRLADMGYWEIIPIAQDTSRYGKDLYGTSRMIELLDGLSKIDGIRWIRPLYLYPDEVTDEMLTYMHDNPKVCNYLDLPIQHIDDRMLKAMNRRGDSKTIRHIIEKARELGDFTLRTTLIVGFPGETEEQFDNLYRFIEEYPFDRLGAFAYSREENTPAADFAGQIGARVKQQRLRKIMSRQQKISKALLEKRVGSSCTVILESKDKYGRFVGRSMWEAPEDVDGCIFVHGDKADIGSMVEVKITGALEYDLVGEML